MLLLPLCGICRWAFRGFLFLICRGLEHFYSLNLTFVFLLFLFTIVCIYYVGGFLVLTSLLILLYKKAPGKSPCFLNHKKIMATTLESCIMVMTKV